MSEFKLVADAEDGRLDAAKRWLPRVGLGLLFIYIGQTKFDNNPHGTWVPVFEKIGFGQWFRYLTGAMQVAGGVLLLIPRTLTLGTALLAATMIGAVIVDLFVLRVLLFFIPGLLLVAIVLAWLTARSG